jgi:ATP-binding cassette subfamily F protein uup
VKALSGGERNRLLLARLFTRPANVLVLDEPTNDLDLETLELVEAELVRWPGTLLLVSHDRVFLDNVVTSTLVFEGGGRVQEYVGGYDDWLRQRDAAPGAVEGADRASPAASGARSRTATSKATALKTAKKLSYREHRELEALPGQIEVLEAEQRTLNGTIADPAFYRQPADAIAGTLDRLQRVERDLVDLYSRWAALDSRPR